MIKNGGTAYHTPADVPHDWAETSFFYFYVPQARVMAWVYLVARRQYGVPRRQCVSRPAATSSPRAV
jgi:hypothetical protein